MKFLIFALLGYLPQQIQVEKLNIAVHKFWHNIDNNQSSFGFIDVTGNVFKESHYGKFDCLYENISNLNDVNLYSDHSIFKYQSQNDMNHFKKTLLYSNQEVQEFKWENTSAHECIMNEEYIRVDFFGNVFRKNEKECKKIIIPLSKYEYFQKVQLHFNYLFTIHSNNTLCIYKFDSEISLVHVLHLPHSDLIKKMEVKKYGDFFHIMILYQNDTIDMITFLRMNQNFELFHHHTINNTHSLPIIDCSIQKGFLLLAFRSKLIIYKYNSMQKIYEKIQEKTYELPYFTEIFWYRKFVYLNNQNYVPCIKVNIEDLYEN
jgi:hypothetical protein